MRLKGFMPNFFQTPQTGSEKKEFSLKGRNALIMGQRKITCKRVSDLEKDAGFGFRFKVEKLMIIQPKFIFYSVEIKQRNSI